ncbi:MAG: DUF4080 domain-containing protein, partial [bacterium]
HSPAPPYDVLSTKNMTLNDVMQFSYLSKIIDSYYNTKTMKTLFRFAAIQDSSFLQAFLKFAAERFLPNEKPSLDARFKLLFDFSQSTNNDLLYSATLFSYCAAGFFQSTINNMTPLKNDALKSLLLHNHTVLWTDNKKIIERPAYMISFEYNAGDIWLNPETEITKGKYNYLFLLSQGGMSKKISKIIKIP